MERPLGVTLLGVLVIVNGAMMLILGASALFTGNAVASALLVLLLGAFILYLGIATLRLQPWAWTALLVLEVVNIVGGIYAIITTGLTFSTAMTVLIAAVIIAYLFWTPVQRAFGRGPAAAAA